jgi:hypothetical protein
MILYYINTALITTGRFSMLQKMNELIEKHFRLLVAATLVSMIVLGIIIINKYSSSKTQGIELDVIFMALCVFAFTPPLTGLLMKNISRESIVAGFILLILLYAELFLWLLIFCGFSSFPSVQKSIYFLFPLALYVLATGICLFLHKTTNKHSDFS